MFSAYMLNSKGDKIHPCLTHFPMFIVSVSPNYFLIEASCFVYISVGLLGVLELPFLGVSPIAFHDLRSRRHFNSQLNTYTYSCCVLWLFPSSTAK